MPVTPGPNPAAGICTLYTQAHTDGEFLTQEKIEFDQETGWTVLVRTRETSWPAPTYPRPFPFIPLSLYSTFPQLLLPRPPRSLPVPTFGSSPEPPITSLVRSQDAHPLHPTMSLPPPGRDPLSL